MSIPHAMRHLRWAPHHRAEVPPSIWEWQQEARESLRLCTWKGRARGFEHPCQSPDNSACDFRNNPTGPMRFLSPAFSHLPFPVHRKCLCVLPHPPLSLWPIPCFTQSESSTSTEHFARAVRKGSASRSVTALQKMAFLTLHTEQSTSRDYDALRSTDTSVFHLSELPSQCP